MEAAGIEPAFHSPPDRPPPDASGRWTTPLFPDLTDAMPADGNREGKATGTPAIVQRELQAVRIRHRAWTLYLGLCDLEEHLGLDVSDYPRFARPSGDPDS
jgi:hypothetical protein